jgi:hypothetical protein
MWQTSDLRVSKLPSEHAEPQLTRQIAPQFEPTPTSISSATMQKFVNVGEPKGEARASEGYSLPKDP